MPKYLWLILNLYQQKKVFFKICTNWNNQSGVGIKLLKNLRIPLPSLTVQGDIVRVIEQAHAAKRAKEAEARALLESIDGYVLSELGITLPEERREMMFRVPFSRVRGGRFDPIFYSSNVMGFANSSKYDKVPIKKTVKYMITGFPVGGDAQILSKKELYRFVRQTLRQMVRSSLQRTFTSNLKLLKPENTSYYNVVKYYSTIQTVKN